MNAVLAARWIGLRVQPLIPFPARIGQLVPEVCIVLLRDFIQQQFEGWPSGPVSGKLRIQVAPGFFIAGRQFG